MGQRFICGQLMPVTIEASKGFMHTWNECWCPLLNETNKLEYFQNPELTCLWGYSCWNISRTWLKLCQTNVGRIIRLFVGAFLGYAQSILEEKVHIYSSRWKTKWKVFSQQWLSSTPNWPLFFFRPEVVIVRFTICKMLGLLRIHYL